MTDLTPDQADALAMLELMHEVMSQRDYARELVSTWEAIAETHCKDVEFWRKRDEEGRRKVAELELLRKVSDEALVYQRKVVREYRNRNQVLERQAQLGEQLAAEREGIAAVLESVADELASWAERIDQEGAHAGLIPSLRTAADRLRQASRSQPDQPEGRTELAQDVKTGGRT